jgi:predicted transcriptional regulator
VARKRSPALTEAELKLMKVLWDRGEGTVSDVLDGLPGPRKPAYNTVLTLLRILEKKGYLMHRKEARAYVYLPLIGRDQARQSALAYMLSRFFDNSPEQLVLNLLRNDGVNPDEIRRVRRLIAESEARPGRS